MEKLSQWEYSSTVASCLTGCGPPSSEMFKTWLNVSVSKLLWLSSQPYFEQKVGSDDLQGSLRICVLHGSVTGTTQLATQLTCTAWTAHRPGDERLAKQPTPEPWCSNFLCDAQLFSPLFGSHSTRPCSDCPLLFFCILVNTLDFCFLAYDAWLLQDFL